MGEGGARRARTRAALAPALARAPLLSPAAPRPHPRVPRLRPAFARRSLPVRFVRIMR